jgi:hypothetical protein
MYYIPSDSILDDLRAALLEKRLQLDLWGKEIGDTGLMISSESSKFKRIKNS